jgi:Family of unknown function (DUF6152)
MQRRQFLLVGVNAALWHSAARAHHGWSSFDQSRPIYLEGRARKVEWRNPHAEIGLELRPGLTLPADLAQRPIPAQTAPVEGAKLLAAAQLPTRKDPIWEIELAPLTRLEAWNVPVVKVGDPVAVVGFTFSGEKGDPVLRAEYLFLGGKAYGLRSSPA